MNVNIKLGRVNQVFDFNTNKPLFIDTSYNTTIFDALYYNATGILKDRYKNGNVSVDTDITDAVFVERGILYNNEFISFINETSFTDVYNRLISINKERELLNSRGKNVSYKEDILTLEQQITSLFILITRYYRINKANLVKLGKLRAYEHNLKSQMEGLDLGICPLCNQVIRTATKDFLSTKAEYNIQCIRDSIEDVIPKIQQYIPLISSKYGILAELYKLLGVAENKNLNYIPDTKHDSIMEKVIDLESEFLKINDFFKDRLILASTIIEEILGIRLNFSISSKKIDVSEKIKNLSKGEFIIIDIVLTILLREGSLYIVDYTLDFKRLENVFLALFKYTNKKFIVFVKK